MIPVTIVTGFLGAGKTTLVQRILRDPGFARTAVIVNEFGEIGLDHDLIASSTENLVALSTGCLCCAMRGDLVTTLLDLAARRAAGDIPAYDRVLIETSGLADPTPILHALMTDAEIAAGHAIGAILTLVDAVHGGITLDRHPEARRQAALADTLLLSKTDIAADTAQLRDRLAAINPLAPIFDAGRGLVPANLFQPAPTPAQRLEKLRALPDLPAKSPFARARHSDGIDTFALVRDRPIPALALTLWLQSLTEHCGARLLRLKGLVGVAEMAETPAVIHGVRHVFAAPDWLDAWPTADRTTRVVFIAQGVPRHFPARLLDAIETEVREVIATAGTGQPCA